MSAIFTRSFALDAGERALRTFCQTLLAIWGGDAGLNFLFSLDLLDVPWIPALSVAGGAALLSVLTSIVSAPVGDPGTPSLVPSRGRHAKLED